MTDDTDITEEDKKSLAIFHEDQKWIKYNRLALAKEYPDLFVAIFDKKVVGTDDNVRELIIKLYGKGLNPMYCTIRLMTEYDDCSFY